MYKNIFKEVVSVKVIASFILLATISLPNSYIFAQNCNYFDFVRKEKDDNKFQRLIYGKNYKKKLHYFYANPKQKYNSEEMPEFLLAYIERNSCNIDYDYFLNRLEETEYCWCFNGIDHYSCSYNDFTFQNSSIDTNKIRQYFVNKMGELSKKNGCNTPQFKKYVELFGIDQEAREKFNQYTQLKLQNPDNVNKEDFRKVLNLLERVDSVNIIELNKLITQNGYPEDVCSKEMYRIFKAHHGFQNSEEIFYYLKEIADNNYSFFGLEYALPNSIKYLNKNDSLFIDMSWFSCNKQEETFELQLLIIDRLSVFFKMRSSYSFEIVLQHSNVTPKMLKQVKRYDVKYDFAKIRIVSSKEYKIVFKKK